MIRTGIAEFKGVAHLRQEYPSDAALQGYEHDKDTIVVAHIRGQHVASLIVRPVMWVHGLLINPSFSRHIQARGAEAAFNYAFGWAPAAPRLIRGGIFQIDAANDRMEAIANSLGGIEEEATRTFRIDL